MKRYAESLARQKRIALPAGYATSGATCRAFLEEHAPRKPAGAGDVTPSLTGASEKRASPDEAKQPAKKRRRRPDATPADRKAPQRRKTRRSKLAGRSADASPALARQDGGTTTPLNIPYGNKEVALKLGARYSAGGWYAPAGIDLSPFRDKGWL
jgi:DNA topoisomerase-3